MASGVKNFVAVAGLLLALLFSQNAAAVINNYYFSSGAAAQSACYAAHGSVSCAATNNASGYKYWWDPGWGTTDNYWYTTVPGIDQCVGKPYTRLGQCRNTAFTSVECTNFGLFSDGAGNCVATTPDCGDLGQTWDAVAGACEWPDVPPTCGAGEMATVNSAGATIACTPMVDTPDTCDYAKGYDASGYFICGDAEAECTAKGGTAGYIDGSTVCIPAGYSPPVCDSTKAVMLDGGGFVCSTPADVKPTPTGEVTDPSGTPAPAPETSTTPSGQAAAPGTGTTGGGSGGTGTTGTPAPEAHEGTPEAGKSGQARASGNCTSPPICSGGDPQMCALIRQQWEAMCKGNDLVENADENQRGVLEGKFADGVSGFGSSTVLEGLVDDGIGAVKVGPVYGATVGTFEGFIAGLLPNGGACADLAFSYLSHTVTISCTGTAIIRSLLGWVFYVLTAWHIFGIVMRPAEG